jgi:hypothetical protein
LGLTRTKTHHAAGDVLAAGVLLRRRGHLDRLGVLDGRQSRPQCRHVTRSRAFDGCRQVLTEEVTHAQS